MTSFAAAQRMTTAESPEPLTFQHSEFIIHKQILLEIVGLGGEAF